MKIARFGDLGIREVGKSYCNRNVGNGEREPFFASECLTLAKSTTDHMFLSDIPTVIVDIPTVIITTPIVMPYVLF